MQHWFLPVTVVVLVGLTGQGAAWSPGAAAAPAEQLAPNAVSPLGTNTDFFRWFSSEWVFVDAFKQSRPWLPQCVPNQQPDCTFVNSFDTGEGASLDLDTNGWVRSLPRPQDPPIYWLVGTRMFENIDGHYPAGQYVVLYEGQGTIVYSADARRNAALSSAGRDVLDVTPTAVGITMQLTATDSSHIGDYLRNIRVIMPGFEATYATQVFHPTYLDRIRKYKTIRFKDWLETDHSSQSSWATRTLPSAARYVTPGGAGLPIELMMALANRNQSDAWVNMPHMATDDYITQFATLVKATLASSARVYVEYSNEVWNGSPGFEQSAWVQQQAVSRWTGPESPFTKQMNWHGMRTAQMCDIWRQVWAADSHRVVCVVGAQSGNPFTASQALDCPLWVEGRPCNAHGISAVAIGAYFGVYMGNNTFQPQVQTWTSDPDGGLSKVFQEVTQGGVLTGGPAGGAFGRVRQEVAGHAVIATQRGLYVVAYEGGSHLQDLSTPQSPAVIALFNQANHDPRMGPVYDQYFADWRAAARSTAATRLFVHFKNVAKPNNIGSLGALEHVDESTSPKFDSLMRFVDNTPCWWPGCTAISPPTTPSPTTVPVPCTPRPNVALAVVPVGTGRLQATVAAQANPSTPGNALQSVQFTSANGALIQDLGGNPIAAFSTVTPPAGTSSYSFYVRQLTPGAAATVSLTVVDGCGGWPTFVGGGPGAFPSGGSGITGAPSATPTTGASAPTAAASPPATITPGPTRTQAIICEPRPAPLVATAPGSPGQLQVTVSAAAVDAVVLRELHFGAATNALIEAGGQRRTGDFAVALPPGTRQTTFTLTRLAAGQGATVPLTVTDVCGNWPTLVGGGPEAF